ncbi:MAG: TonB-dependent receptor [Sphingobacteriales bacterium SCN 48-20]|nr:MAG: TonB-dependent receptor [Sphingobacteriales bacterium SCN 48-20]OJW40623.1 MAG: TonB-dependent receptor [Sphingobacteriales bacterium 48-107]
MIMTGCLLSAAMLSFGQTTAQRDSFDLLSPVEVRAVRAGEKAPFAKSNLSKTEIAKRNLGQDIPFVLNLTPSVVVNSDAGTGIGYTGLRIRGTDATRINITLNGIPYNDAESQGTFFVNLPDFTSSVNSIQIQRGVGTSSNGTGAFGATVSLSTNEVNAKPYAEFNNAYGSFDTWKNTVKAGTGLINDHFTVDARLSRISSSGYIDRASSDLQSFYLSGAYLNKGSSLRLNIFSGKEKTYQAWNGVPENLKETNRTYNSAGTDRPGAPYDNETDNYTQTHYQLFFDQKLNTSWQFNTALYLTRGKGYYENYKGNEKLSKYGLPNLVLGDTTISRTDLVRQKWLDNYFYGQILSLQYRKDRHEWVIGGGWSRYQGDHFGKVIWAKYGFDEGYRYYDNDAWKTDVNVYTKWQYQLTTAFSLFADLQYRRVQHRMNGFEENPALTIDRSFNFFNPKAGITYRRNGWQAFVSYAHAGKEPNRDDFQASLNNQPKKETLHDFEAGVEKRTSRFSAGVNLYYMLYKDQLVQTGMINDVGAYTRINVPNSYRMGIELQGGVIINKWLNASANLTLSRNKIKAFTEFLDDYDADFEWIGQQSVRHRNTDIAFSPALIAGGSINILPVKNFEISLLEKYVGRQYMDNTQNKERSLDDFFTQDVRALYTLRGKRLGEWTLIGQVNNVFNRRYEPNGYTYSYVFDGSITADKFYMPMAGTNFMVGVNVRL